MIKLDGFGARRPMNCPAASASAWLWHAPWCARPKVLLLDEPLGALDRRLRESMQMELRALQKSVGITFVFVTHDQEEALVDVRPHRGDVGRARFFRSRHRARSTRRPIAARSPTSSAR